MMRTLAALLILLLFPAAAQAEQVLPVRAGEHGEYSRLVIPNAPDDWRIATSNRKVEITFSDKDYSFELSDLIDKRKAHRVLSARTVDTDDARSLVLSLTCDCPVRTSKSAQNSIVIDIFNEAPQALLPEEDTITPSSTISDAARQSGSATPENMRAARDRMIALLAEARHQGVVQLKADEKHASAPSPAGVTPVSQASLHVPDQKVDHAQNDPIAAQAPLAEHTIAAADIVPAAECVDPALFAETEGDAGQINYAVISNLRQRLEMTDDDDVRRDLASTLAIAYIHIGFFEEASAIAAPRAKEGDGNMAVAAALAELASGETAHARKTLSKYQQCGTFFEMVNAAASDADRDSPTTLMEKHVIALKSLTASLRAPFAEKLALDALDSGDKSIATSFYEVALQARGDEQTAALAILERALATEPKQVEQAAKKLTDVAKTPGPMQAKALALLAEDYQERADLAYEGLLDDIAGQTVKRGGSLSDARAAFSGAKALASAGRLHEGVAILNTASKSAPAVRAASQTLAQSMIMNGLLEDEKTRLSAIAAFFQFNDFISDADSGDVNIAVARELALLGASSLVDSAVENLSDDWSAQSDAVKALARLNSGDADGALAITSQGAQSPELAAVAIRAHERLGESKETSATIRSAMRDGISDKTFSSAAWRAADWSLAIEAFEKTAADQRDASAASRVALAALNTGAKSLPAAIRDVLTKDPEALAALAHMFVSAPGVNIRAIDLLADYSRGVSKETIFMQKGLAPEGDVR